MNKNKDFTVKFIYEYLLCLAACIIFVIAAGSIAKFYFSGRIWYDTDPMWHYLHWLDNNILFAGTFSILVGWLVISLFFIIRAVRYLKMVVTAAGQLTDNEVNYIRLPVSLKDIQDDLNGLKESSRRSDENAREAEQRKNDLIVYLAHDLKTPLTSVIGYLSILEEQPELDVAQRSKFIGIALDKSMRLEQLINEFFDITRFNLQSVSLDLENINLSRMIEQLTNEFIPILNERGLSWDLYITQGIYLLADADKIERVIDNLIRNAALYSYSDSRIYFSLDQDEENIIIVLKNHGKTISAEKLKHIFEKFFRADNARGSYTGGSGLGLAIAKEIVELHGGSIQAESLDETITFTVSFPKKS